MIKIAIYARSAVKNDDNIKRQISKIKDALQKFSLMKMRLEFYEYIDNGKSGMTMDRPGLKKLLEDLESKNFNSVCAVDKQRFSRDPNHLKEILKKLNGSELFLNTLKESFQMFQRELKKREEKRKKAR